MRNVAWNARLAGDVSRSACVVLVLALISLGSLLVPTKAPYRAWATDPWQIFTFIFLMLGPIKILGPFVSMTKDADDGFRRSLALRAFAYSTVSVVVAALVGGRSLDSYGIPTSVLSLSAGIILFLVALWIVLRQFTVNREPPVEYRPSMDLALSPLTFPIIVTPYGAAAVIVFTALSTSIGSLAMVFAILIAVMALNLVSMLYARHIMKWAAVPLQILGTVLGVIQVALGLYIILITLDTLGIIRLAIGGG